MWFHTRTQTSSITRASCPPPAPSPARLRTTGLLFVATEETYLASSLISGNQARAGIWAGPLCVWGVRGAVASAFTLRRGHTVCRPPGETVGHPGVGAVGIPGRGVVDACSAFSWLNIWETGCRSRGKCMFGCKNWPMFSQWLSYLGARVLFWRPMVQHPWRTGCFHRTVRL